MRIFFVVCMSTIAPIFCASCVIALVQYRARAEYIAPARDPCTKYGPEVCWSEDGNFTCHGGHDQAPATQPRDDRGDD